MQIKNSMSRQITILKDDIELKFELLEEYTLKVNTGTPEEKALARRKIPELETGLKNTQQKFLKLLNSEITLNDKEKLKLEAKSGCFTKAPINFSLSTLKLFKN